MSYTADGNPRSEQDQPLAQNGRSLIELLAALDIYSSPSGIRKTGIICTIGAIFKPDLLAAVC